MGTGGAARKVPRTKSVFLSFHFLISIRRSLRNLSVSHINTSYLYIRILLDRSHHPHFFPPRLPQPAMRTWSSSNRSSRAVSAGGGKCPLPETFFISLLRISRSPFAVAISVFRTSIPEQAVHTYHTSNRTLLSSSLRLPIPSPVHLQLSISPLTPHSLSF